MPPRRTSEPIQIDILIEAEGWPSASVLRRLARRAVDAAAAEAQLKFGKGAELSLVFADDERLRGLNAAYRGKDMPTNVLSFPSAATAATSDIHLLGDIVLGLETIEMEAKAGSLTMNDHLVHLIVHGFLHLCGYDHETDDQAAVMEGLESRVLERLGVADPYAVPRPGA
jgi:probable rRNA maturation factor